jgi:hypothetical protein
VENPLGDFLIDGALRQLVLQGKTAFNSSFFIFHSSLKKILTNLVRGLQYKRARKETGDF